VMMETVIDKLALAIVDAVPDAAAVYLFGSLAREDMHKNSDIDLAVLCDCSMSAIELWKLAQKLAIIAERDIDLLDLRKASTVMQMQVVSQGRRLWCQNFAACEQFEDFVFSDYARLNEERAGILESVRQQGVIYG